MGLAYYYAHYKLVIDFNWGVGVGRVASKEITTFSCFLVLLHYFVILLDIIQYHVCLFCVYFVHVDFHVRLTFDLSL